MSSSCSLGGMVGRASDAIRPPPGPQAAHLPIGLSDEQLAAQLARDLLFRKFCRLEIDAATPDATTIGRFRARLEAEGRLAALFEAVKAQLAAKNVIMGDGRVAIIDATVVEAARTGRRQARARARRDTRDPEAGAHVKINARGRKVGTWGYQFQVNADEDGFIHAQVVTPGNAHEIRSWEALMTGGESRALRRLRLFGAGDAGRRWPSAASPTGSSARATATARCRRRRSSATRRSG